MTSSAALLDIGGGHFDFFKLFGFGQGEKCKAWIGGMGFWVQSKGKGSWSGDSLVKGRGATWEKKARELGGVLSLNQKRKGRKAACVNEKE